MMRLITLSVLLLSCALPLQASEPELPEDQAPVHWAFATLLGTGWYKIDESRSIFVLRIPPRWTIRESSYEPGGERKVGIDLRLPVTLGLHNVDDLPGIIEPDNFGTISFTPGVDVEVPVTEDFYLRPFANIGWGTEVGNEYSAWIYKAGIKSRYTFEAGRNQFALIGNIYYAGYKPNEGISDDLGGIALGVEGRLPFRNFSMFGKPMAFDWHVMYTHFSNKAIFTIPNDEPQFISDIIEFGIALSPQNERWDFWLWKPERLGIGYQYDLEGNFSAITINFTSWFRR